MKNRSLSRTTQLIARQQALWHLALGTLLAFTLSPTRVTAQVVTEIIRDGTVRPDAPFQIEPQGTTYTIGETHGERPGGGPDLFHSFRTFNVGKGDTALFTADFPTENVISRVTGGARSNIHGTISSNIPGANLYLLNPSGVLFGPTSSLDVMGSFHIGTPEPIPFPSLDKFNAGATNRTSLSLARLSDYGFLAPNSPDARANVSIQGTLIVPFGREISIVEKDLQIPGIVSAPGGKIFVAADNLVIDGGTITTSNSFFSDADAGSIEINVANELVLRQGRIEAENKGSGRGGAIALDVGALTMLDDSRINASRRGFGGTRIGAPAGSISVTAKHGILLSSLGIEENGFINTASNDSTGGSISISTPTLRIVGHSGIEARTGGTQNAVTIMTERLVLENGGAIAADSFSSFGDNIGPGAAIAILASESIRIVGEGEWVDGAGDQEHRVSTISASSINLPGLPSAAGAGTIRVSTPLLDLAGGQISAITTGEAAGGDIDLNVDRLRMADGAAVAARSEGPGNAGAIRINDAKTVRLSESRITTSAIQGAGGEIIVGVGESLSLHKGSFISSSVAGGGGGDIEIGQPETTLLLDGSRIEAEAQELGGRGGAVEITTDLFVRSRDSEVSASAPGGPQFQGTVEINAPEGIVEAGLTQLSTNYLNASAMLRPSCAARTSGAARSGSFAVVRRQGLPTSPEDLLLAFDAIVPEELAVATAEEDGDLPSVASGHPASEPSELAQVALADGAMAFRGGHFDEAGRRWSKASELFAASGDSKSRSDALRALAQTQQALGQYSESLGILREALTLARESGDKARIASALGNLGNGYLATGESEEARDLLTQAISLAKEAGETALAAAILNNLGNLEASRTSFDKALAAYENSAELARNSGRGIEEARTLSNAARVALESGDLERASGLLQKASSLTLSLNDAYAKIHILIHVGKSHERLAASAIDGKTKHLLQAHDALLSAVELSQNLHDQRSLSYALGNLGALYQSEHRIDEALYLTRRALRAAEEADAAESIYRWHWQEGQLLWALGRASEAVAAYRRAVGVLEDTRQETLSRYGSAEIYFRQLVAPAYLELINALLQSAAMLDDAKSSHELLVEARATMEMLKAAELRDYFRDECVADLEAKTQNLDALAEAAAVVYPILLPDRTELLLTLPSGLRRYSVPVGSARITQEVRHLRDSLTGLSRSYLRHSQQLYDWLIRPFDADLANEEVDTLVFVPDGPLRTIPLAALHDGDQFLIQRYGVATTPGLRLVEPKPLDRSEARPLLAGVSEAAQGYPSLAHVPAELDAVHSFFGGQILLDQDFLLQRAEREIAEGHPTIVHIASHAQFTGDPSTSFLLAYDGKLTMERLHEAVSPAQFRDEPLELLVLSGCETAAGDDRAALGLAGLAVRSGARSAVGSLWPIGDEPTLVLVKEFYRKLQDPETSRAEALRQAQLKLLDSDLYWHPRYWSPFLLISNWL